MLKLELTRPRNILLRRPLEATPVEVLNVEPVGSLLLVFAPLPYCSQNKTAVSDTQHLLLGF